MMEEMGWVLFVDADGVGREGNAEASYRECRWGLWMRGIRIDVGSGWGERGFVGRRWVSRSVRQVSKRATLRYVCGYVV